MFTILKQNCHADEWKSRSKKDNIWPTREKSTNFQKFEPLTIQSIHVDPFGGKSISS